MAEGGITSQQRATRDAIANKTADTREFGADTAKFRHQLRLSPDDLDIELSGLSLRKLPNLGADLGFTQSVILEGLTDLRETTQTHMRDLLVSAPDELFTTLNVGSIGYLTVDQENTRTMIQINFVGPITERIELGGIDIPDTELSLAAPTIMVTDMLIETLKVGAGCMSLAVVGLKNLKTIEIAEPGILAAVRFHNLPAIEHYTDIPATAHLSGDVFLDAQPLQEEGPVRNLLPAFTELPDLPLTPIPEITLPFANQQVYDFEENEEVPMITLLSKMGHIIFKARDSYFTLPVERLYDAMDDESQVRYKCNSKLEGAPYTHQVDMANPYYYIQGNGNFIVSLAALNSGLHEYKVLELVESTETLENIASANSVQTTPGVNRFGNQVDIVSADHCQAGTQQKVFELRGVILIHEAPAPVAAVEDKRKRSESDSDVSRAASIVRTMSTGGKRTVSKKRRTYKKKRNYKGPYINPTYNTLPFKR
jgi:hypothetical protein